MKKKILYMDMVWGFGGIESYILNILDHINADEYTFDIALPGLYKHVNEDALTNRGVNVIHYPANNIVQQVREVTRILAAGNYDIIHVMQNHPSLEAPAIFSLVAIAVQKKYKYKIISHAHNTENTMRTVGFVKKQIRSIFRYVLRSCFAQADLLAACSTEAGEFLYGRSKCVNIFYNGINLHRFMDACGNASIPSCRKKYEIDNRNLNFVIVARMAEQKNPLFLLDVVKALRKYYPNLRFYWVGDGELRNNIVNHIEENGLYEVVQLLGSQKNVEEILACCNYLLFPSKMEGAPLVLIEAQAAGLKCFASDRVPNVIDCGGVSFIELDKTAEEWASEIHRQIAQEPQTIIDMDLLKRFDINKTVKALSDVYNRLVES